MQIIGIIKRIVRRTQAIWLERRRATDELDAAYAATRVGRDARLAPHGR